MHVRSNSAGAYTVATKLLNFVAALTSASGIVWTVTNLQHDVGCFCRSEAA
jgi:hypothetical protein